jgi:hypothetical protein
MSSHHFVLAFDVTGPLLTKSQDAARLGLDAHGLTHRDMAVIGGAHVRGHLRQALAGCVGLLADRADLLAELAHMDALLGKDSADGDAPERALLRFPARFVAEREGEQRTLHRIRIDPVTGRVDDGALLMLESPLAPGETIRFSGQLRLDADSPLSAERICHWLQRALSLVPAMGSGKSIGFGRIGNVQVKSGRLDSAAFALPADLKQRRYRLRLSLDRPFCFADPRGRNDNRFASLPYVPGAALLGALLAYARAHANDGDCKTLLANAERLRFTHAHPVRTGAPQALPAGPVPRSWALAGDTLYELAACTSSTVIGGEAPAFSVDWKPEHTGQVERFRARQSDSALPDKAEFFPKRVLTVRTAIEHARNSADDSKLFATDCIDPQDFDWSCDLGIGDGADPAIVLPALSRVLPRALHSLGKTKAEAQVLAFTAVPGHAQIPALAAGDLVALTLHSDAAVPIDVGAVKGTGASEALRAAYDAVFRALSAGRLSVMRQFAGQRLAGGKYLHHRFWAPAERPYRPLVLTESGSVFVLKVEQTDGLPELLRDWLDHGLPVGDELTAAGLAAWQLNPYRRGNGYGEVRLRKLPAAGPEKLHTLVDAKEVKA